MLIIAAAAPDAWANSFLNGQSFYGQPAGAETRGRVVNVDTSRHLNVEYGETVVFRRADRQFAWTFNGLDRRAVDLAKIAPADFSGRPFVIYVAEDPGKSN